MVCWVEQNIVLLIEFQKRGSGHVYSFIWNLNAPNIENKAAFINFIEKTINAQLPDPPNDPELFELVKTSKFMLTQKFAGNTTKMNTGQFHTEKTTNGKPLDSELTNDEKLEVLAWIKALLKKVKKYIDDNLDPAKVNVIAPTKDNFTQPLCIQEILDELDI